MTLAERVKTFTGWQPGNHEPTECRCDHKLQGTGAVFYQSVGVLHCARCRGWQLIRKPVE